MSPPKYHSPSFLLIIIIAFTLSTFLQQHATIRADSSSPQNYLFHICSASRDGGGNSSNYSSSYETNLNKLFGYLTCRAPPTGFGLGSFGPATATNNPHAVALCRGDVSPAVCEDCILHATNDVVQRCRPGDRSAVIWYDNCLLKYSDTKFFGQIDYRNKFYMANARNVSDNPASFDGKVRELLGRLAGEAANSWSSKLYSAGEMEVDDGSSMKVYGLTQCSRDLSRNECNKCLQGIIGELPRCCHGRQGGRVVGATCNFIYEIYPFLNL